MDIDEEIDVRIVMELHTIHVTVPAKWSINKLKCLVVTLVPVFEFDAFAIAHRSYLLRGDYKLKDLRCGRNIQVSIVKIDCKGEYAKYYEKSINRFLSWQVGQSVNVNPQLSKCYYQAIQQKEQQQGRIINQVVVEGAVNEQQRGAFGIVNILSAFGVLWLMSLITTHATLQQMLVIMLAILVYYVVELQMNWRRNHQRDHQLNANQGGNHDNANQGGNHDNANQVNNNVNREEVEPRQEPFGENSQIRSTKNKVEGQSSQMMVRKKGFSLCKYIKGILVYLFACVVQLLICFFLSMYPNWKVQVHLEKNGLLMTRVANYCKHSHDGTQEPADDVPVKQQSSSQDQP